MKFLVAGLPSYLHRKLIWLAHVGYHSPSEVEAASDLGAVLSWRVVHWVLGKYCVTMSPLYVNFSPGLLIAHLVRVGGLLCFHLD